MKRVPLLESFSFQPPIIDKDLTAPPGGEAEGDRYIVGGSATGDWAGHDDDIAEYDGVAWMFMTPEEGWFVHINDEDKFYKFTGSVWEELTGGSGGDMYKSVYDTGGEDGIVDKAESIDDGTNQATAGDLADAVTKKHETNKDTTLDSGGANEVTAADAKDAVTKKHEVNKDVGLDEGGTNPITAAQAKEAFDKKGVYNAVTKCIEFDI